MTAPGEYLSIQRLTELASANVGAGEEALSLPLPQRVAGGLRVRWMMYGEPQREGVEEVYPPSRIISIEPCDGAIEVAPCTPADFGVTAAAGAPVQGFGLTLGAAEYWRRRDRFEAIAGQVWRAFEHDQRDDAAQAAVREHDVLFHSIAKKPLVPYYEHLGADYFAWVKTLE